MKHNITSAIYCHHVDCSMCYSRDVSYVSMSSSVSSASDNGGLHDILLYDRSRLNSQQ